MATIFEKIPLADGKHSAVFLDAREYEKSRGPQMPWESEAMVIAMDALACGRSIRTTVENVENFGGQVSPEAKILLGLLGGFLA